MRHRAAAPGRCLRGDRGSVLAQAGEPPGFERGNQKGVVARLRRKSSRAQKACQRIVGIGANLGVHRGRVGHTLADLAVRPSPGLGVQRQGRVGGGCHEQNRRRQVRTRDACRKLVVGEHPERDPGAQLGPKIDRFRCGRDARRGVAPGKVLLVEVDVGK